MSATIYHYEQCSKSTGALALLAERGIQTRIIDYRAQPPSVDELLRLRDLMGCTAIDMLRTGDKHFRDLGFSAEDRRSDGEWFALVQQHPMILQRPIVVIGDRAIIARPADLVLTLID